MAPSAPPSDWAICEALASGEAWAAAALYHRVASTTNGVLYRILGEEDSDRSDLAQEVFERVINSVTSGRFARSCDLPTWAAVITQHVAFDRLRKRKRERALFVDQDDTEVNVAAPAQTPEKTVEIRRRFERLVIALHSMRKVRVEAVVLFNVLGYDIRAIARITGVSVAAAQSRVVRGRGDVLRRILSQERVRTNGSPDVRVMPGNTD
jgi:RNA polymerase sigma-70 factor (ECF subfamily)